MKNVVNVSSPCPFLFGILFGSRLLEQSGRISWAHANNGQTVNTQMGKRIKLSENTVAALASPSSNINTFLQLTYNSKPTGSFIDYEQTGTLYPTTSRSSLILHAPREGDEWIVAWQGKKRVAWKGCAHVNDTEFVLIPNGNDFVMEKRVVLSQFETIRDNVPNVPPPVSLPLVKNSVTHSSVKHSKSSDSKKSLVDSAKKELPSPKKQSPSIEQKKELPSVRKNVPSLVTSVEIPMLQVDRLATPHPRSVSPSSTSSHSATDLDSMALELEMDWDEEISMGQSHTPASVVYDHSDHSPQRKKPDVPQLGKPKSLSVMVEESGSDSN